MLDGDGVAPLIAIDLREEVVALPYSSGATGLPKGVMLTHHNLVANLCQISHMGLVREQDVVIGVLLFYHIYGLMVILSLGLANGATIVSLPRFDLPQLLQTLQDYRVTVGNVVPPIMLALAKQLIVDNYDLSALRVILSAAAPLGKALQEEVAQRLGCLVIQGWGMTGISQQSCSDLCHAGRRWLAAHRRRRLLRRGWLPLRRRSLEELIKYKGMQVAPAELEACC